MTGLLSTWRAWSERRQILRDIRRQEADDREKLRFKIKDDLTHALQALERDDRKYASIIWKKMIERNPDMAKASPLALQLLIGLQQYEEAEALMRDGQKKHPGDPYFAKGLAEIAHTKRDFDKAIEHWAFLRKRFPGVIEGYTYGAHAFMALDQLDRAETLALEAIKRFPDQMGGPLEYARIAAKRGKWDEALRRWQPIRERFGYFGGYVGSAQALSHLGRYDEAEEILRQARYRFGTDPGPLSEFARVAEARGDVSESVQRWKGVLSRFPLDMHVHLDASAAFERLGEPAEAEATLRKSIDRFPAEVRPPLELARLLHHRRRDFPSAAKAWAELRQTFPDTEEAYTSGIEAFRQAGRLDEAEALCEKHGLRFTTASSRLPID